MKVTTGLSTRKNFSDCTFVKVKVTANNVLFGSFVTAEISSHDNVYCIKPLSVVPLQKVFSGPSSHLLHHCFLPSSPTFSTINLLF